MYLIHANAAMHFKHATSAIILILASGVASAAESPGLFAESSLESGIYAEHKQRGAYLRGLPDTLGPGACVADFNNDLWPDLLVLAGQGATRHYGKPSWWQNASRNRLYLNKPGGGFVPVTSKAGLDETVNGQGCLTGDFDQDGHADILITTTGTDLLYRNNGDATFTQVERSPLTRREEWTTNAVLVDVNGDGRKDIYVSGFIDYEQNEKVFEGRYGYESAVSAHFRPEKFNAITGRLYLNQGDFSFTEVTGEAGLTNESGRTLGTYWHDLNNDELPDLMEINGFGSEARVWINQGDTRFSAPADAQKFVDTGDVTSAAFADIVGDKRIDAVFTGLATKPLTIRDALTTDETWHRHRIAETSLATASWGLAIADFNNDARQDIVFANGSLRPHMDAPASPQGSPDTLYLSQGKTYRQFAIPETELNKSSRAVVTADFDNNGALDLYVSANNSLGQLYMNQTREGHWLQILPLSGSAHAQAISVTVSTPGREFRKSVGERFGYLGNSSRRMHFGLGDFDGLIDVSIRRSDSSIDRYEALKPDSLYLLAPNEEPCRARGAVRSRLSQCARKAGFRNGSVKDSSKDKALLRALLGYKNHLLHGKELETNLEGLSPKTRNIAREHDEPVYWLSHALTNAREDTACQLARHAMELFDEEEAALRNKYMLINPLIRTLDNTSSDARACVIKALGHSERYRANLAVLDMLDTDNQKVQAASIIALGRLRQRGSLPHLQSMIDSGDPEAAALAALSAERIEAGQGIARLRNRMATANADERSKLQRAFNESRERHPLMGRAR